MSHIQSIATALTAHGWNTTDLEKWGSATKVFATAVGPKEAHAYLRLAASEPRANLSGEYWSEGRNVLSTCTHAVPLDDEAALIGAVNAFALEADRQVKESYAARLLRFTAPAG